MAVDILRKNIALKVVEALEKQGKAKSWLASEMGFTRKTLYNKLESNFWTVAELIRLQDLLGIK